MVIFTDFSTTCFFTAWRDSFGRLRHGIKQVAGKDTAASPYLSSPRPTSARFSQRLTTAGVLALLVTGLGTLASVPTFAPASAQSSTAPISLLNMARYYSGLPHQDRALALLQSQIQTLNPALLQADSIASNVWRDTSTLAGHEDILSQIPAAKRAGANPLTLAIDNASLRVGQPMNIELLSGPNVESPNQVMVTVDQSATLDDSVAGVRHRFDMTLRNGQWEIVKAGRQVRCQLGRGHQEWAASGCL